MTNKLPSFDHLLKLAQENPEALERLRERYFHDVIDNADEHSKRRLRGLQFRIDYTRKLAKTPLSACIDISNMMHKSLNELTHLLNQATGSAEAKRSPFGVSAQSVTPTHHKTDILEFPKT